MIFSSSNFQFKFFKLGFGNKNRYAKKLMNDEFWILVFRSKENSDEEGLCEEEESGEDEFEGILVIL